MSRRPSRPSRRPTGSPSRCRAAAALVLALVTLSAGLGSAPVWSAPAEDNLAPVTAPDSYRMWSGGVRDVDLLANDTDPEGDELAVCRLELPANNNKAFVATILGGTSVATNPRAQGDFVFTYYACDFTRLTPATATVTLRRAEKVTVEKLDGRPGLVKVTNPNPAPVKFLIGDATANKPDATAKVPAKSSTIVRVRHAYLVWLAFIGRELGNAGIGQLKRVALPPRDAAQDDSKPIGGMGDTATSNPAGLAARWLAR